MGYRLAAARLKVPVVETPLLSDAEQAAAKLVASKKPGAEAPAFGPPRVPGAPPPPLAGYYAMEARNFADGTRSILDVRNALAAEFGPVSVDDVTRFFRDAEKAGTFVIAEKPEPKKTRQERSKPREPRRGEGQGRGPAGPGMVHGHRGHRPWPVDSRV